MSDLFFGLREGPFPAAPLAAAYFAAEQVEHSRRQLQRCLERAEGAGVIIGAAGIGKSLLLQVLAAQFRDRFHVAHLAGAAICTRRALLQSILFELGLPYRGLQEGELRLSLIDHLQPSRQCPQGMLLLIDEAHTLPLRLLEELRLLTNLVREGMPRVRLLLAGSRALEERLANPKLDSFQQRIAVRAYLQPWSSQETAEYIRQEIGRCGGKANTIFSPEALKAIHLAAAGIPRLINQIGDHALTLAAAEGWAKVDATAVQASWADLQQLPAPWSEPAATPSATIEFGALDEAEPSATIDFAPCEVEPVVPSVAELFGDDFEEEIVIDRYVALDAKSWGDRLQVTTPHGQAFAREVAEIVEEPMRLALKIAEVTDDERMPSPHATISIPLVRANTNDEVEPVIEAAEAIFDPVYPEEDEVPARPGANVVAIDSAHPTMPDTHAVKGPLAGRFRNLFANLRGKKS